MKRNLLFITELLERKLNGLCTLLLKSGTNPAMDDWNLTYRFGFTEVPTEEFFEVHLKTNIHTITLSVSSGIKIPPGEHHREVEYIRMNQASKEITYDDFFSEKGFVDTVSYVVLRLYELDEKTQLQSR